MSGHTQISLSTTPESVESQQATETTEQTSTEFGGYASLAELVAAHDALKNPQSAEQTSEAAAATDEKPAKEIPEDDQGASDDAAAQEAVSNAGLDWNALNSEYAQSGKLSDETYAKLDKAGIPKAEVDTYIAGKQAQSDAYDNAVFEAAGGSKEYSSLVEWAKAALSHDEKVAFNKAVTSGHTAEAALAVEALTARRAKTRGTPPSKLLDGRSDAAGVQPFKSQAEVVRAMRDPRYKSDPAYQAEVRERLRDAPF
jgi:hypothetical protein